MLISFEKDNRICRAVQRRITEMFDRNDVIQNENYPNNKQYTSDILILVNCAYADMAKTKTRILGLDARILCLCWLSKILSDGSY